MPLLLIQPCSSTNGELRNYSAQAKEIFDKVSVAQEVYFKNIEIWEVGRICMKSLCRIEISLMVLEAGQVKKNCP